MPDNIIAVLSRGNQELFHSAFIAWLLDRDASHGLGGSFFRGLLPFLGHESAANLSMVTQCVESSVTGVLGSTYYSFRIVQRLEVRVSSLRISSRASALICNLTNM
jgi:PD-(D/E)XK nuclease superfamily protein